MRDKLLALAALQKIDMEIAALRKVAGTYPREIAELEKLVANGRASVDAERTKLDELDRHRSQLEHALSEDRDKVKKWEGRLAEQRTTREYSALAREIDIARKSQQTMSEELIDLGKQAVLQREMVKQRDEEQGTKVKELSERISLLRAKAKEVDGQVKVLDGKRDDSARQVESGLLRRYDNIRRKRMPAMVPVAAPGVCSGCRMNIPAQQFNQLVASKGFDVCPSCQRIIHAAETLAVAAS